jgi:hypothetical protein
VLWQVASHGQAATAGATRSHGQRAEAVAGAISSAGAVVSTLQPTSHNIMRGQGRRPGFCPSPIGRSGRRPPSQLRLREGSTPDGVGYRGLDQECRVWGPPLAGIVSCTGRAGSPLPGPHRCDSRAPRGSRGGHSNVPSMIWPGSRGPERSAAEASLRGRRGAS